MDTDCGWASKDPTHAAAAPLAPLLIVPCGRAAHRCTFEAACVEERQLPVEVAAYGPSRLQRWLGHLGSMTPGIGVGGDRDGVTDTLRRLNLSFYLVELAGTTADRIRDIRQCARSDHHHIRSLVRCALAQGSCL
jgi:hypothetical protein